MAIKIRPVRGEIQESRITGGKNLIRGQEWRGRQFAQAGKIASNFANNILEHEAELEKQHIQNKITDSELYFNRLADEKLKELAEQNTVYSKETTEQIVNQFGMEFDKAGKEYFKNDPMAFQNGGRLKIEKAKLNLFHEINKLRGNQILGQNIGRVETRFKIFKDEAKKLNKQPYNPNTFAWLDTSRKQLQNDINVAIGSGANASVLQESLDELENMFYDNTVLARNALGEIDIEKANERLRNKSGIGGKPIPSEQFDRLNNIINDEEDRQIKEEDNRIKNNNNPIFKEAIKALNSDETISRSSMRKNYTSKIIVKDAATQKFVKHLEEEARKDITERRKQSPDAEQLEAAIYARITLPSYGPNKIVSINQSFQLPTDAKPKSIEDRIIDGELRGDFRDIALERIKKYSGEQYDKLNERKNAVLQSIKPQVYGALNKSFVSKQATIRWARVQNILNNNFFLGLEAGNVNWNKAFDPTDAENFLVPNINAYFPTEQQQSIELSNWAEESNMDIKYPTLEELRKKYNNPNMTLEEAAESNEMIEAQRLMDEKRKLKKLKEEK
tara:strand:+ start:305 stop:1984 length:1680 start_codon:yes stop_codon:yes gene_type:complete